MRFAVSLLAVVIAPLSAFAQDLPRDTTNGWNSQRVLDLVMRARTRRLQPRGDTALRNYSAKAAGHVYFYLDRQDSAAQTLVKVDQVALELFWAAPNLTKQKIVGLRDESRLPNRMYYHLDHLTVVQNGFGDIIRLGDGDEVRDVRHPAAMNSSEIYDFRLSDSLSLNFPPQPPVRVYQVSVRPRRSDRPGLIGTMFIDQASADIVRLTFTFTPASYVDRRLDYINISLDNGLWNGNYWLPNEQYVEIRRQIPELEFAAGAVIKGRLRVYGYEFNRTLPNNFFYGPAIEAASPEERKAFPFEEHIYAGLEREGLSAPPQVADLRATAMELIGQRRISGLPRTRLWVPNASSVLRYNETEGLFLGMGMARALGTDNRIEATGGYAIRAEKPELALKFSHNRDDTSTWARGFVYDPRDFGIRPAVPGAINTLANAFINEDYTDLYFAHGAELGYTRQLNTPDRLTLRGAVERHDLVSVEYNHVFAEARLTRPISPGGRFDGSLEFSIEGGIYREVDDFECPVQVPGTVCLGDDIRDPDMNYLRPRLTFLTAYQALTRGTRAQFTLSSGLLIGNAPVQSGFVLGGVGTIPGHAFHGMIGKSFALGELEVTQQLFTPWLSLRAVGAIGAIVERDNGSPSWPAPIYDSAASIGAGVGLLWDVLRFDVIKGNGKPRLYFSVKPDFWDLL